MESSLNLIPLTSNYIRILNNCIINIFYKKPPKYIFFGLIIVVLLGILLVTIVYSLN